MMNSKGLLTPTESEDINANMRTLETNIAMVRDAVEDAYKALDDMEATYDCLSTVLKKPNV